MNKPTVRFNCLMTGLGMLVALAAAGCSASDRAKDLTLAHFSPLPAALTPGPADPSCAHRDAARMLSLEGPDGHAFGLAYVGGCGWRWIPEARDDGLIDATPDGRRNLPVQNVAAEQGNDTPAPTAEPLAVFIDGPTGYTFVWSRDTGWKFVGHVVEHER